MDEKRLLSDLKNHKADAQKVLFEEYYLKMYHVALRYLTVKEDAEDVLTEAFIRIFNNIERFRYEGEGSLTGWIKTIVINESLRSLSKIKKIEYHENINETQSFTNEDIEANIDLKFLLSLVESLPHGYRIIFNLYVFENFSHKEISTMLNISESTSKSQLYKARNRLIIQLKKYKLYEMGRS